MEHNFAVPLSSSLIKFKLRQPFPNNGIMTTNPSPVHILRPRKGGGNFRPGRRNLYVRDLNTYYPTHLYKTAFPGGYQRAKNNKGRNMKLTVKCIMLDTSWNHTYSRLDICCSSIPIYIQHFFNIFVCRYVIKGENDDSPFFYI